MDDKLAMCRIITNFKNFNTLIDEFIEKFPAKIENYGYITIINSFIINNMFSFDIKYSCSDQDIKDIFGNVFKNIVKEIMKSPSKFTIELEAIN